MCINKDKKTCIKFINGKILKYLSRNIVDNEKIVLNIFENLLEYIPYHYKK